jgi:hypothetical protein
MRMMDLKAAGAGSVAGWIRAGSVVVGVGDNLVAGARNRDFAAINKMARCFGAETEEACGR